MEDDLFRDGSQNILTCNEKNYLNSIISGNLNETVSYFNDSSEEETEMYINNLLNRLTTLDKDIWYSVEVIQNNAYGSLSDLSDLLNSLPDRDAEFKNLVTPLKRVENLTVSIERKYDKTYKLRQLKNLKTLLTSNQRVLSLIYNWDDNIKSVQTLISSYLSHKDSFNLSNKDSLYSLRSDPRLKRYLILGSDGFSMDDLDKLKQILSQLKGDYDNCLNNIGNTNIPQTLGIIMDKYYIILEDLTVDIINFMLLSYKFHNLAMSDPNNMDDSDTSDNVRELDADVVLQKMKLDVASEEKLNTELERYVKYYIFEQSANNINILNRHLRKKLEDMFMNYLRLLCTEDSFDMFTKNKQDLDLINNLYRLHKILNAFLNYLFLALMAIKSPYYFIISLYLRLNRDDADAFESDVYHKLHRERSFDKDGLNSSLEDQLDKYFRKLVLKILSSCILNSNVFYLVSTLAEDDLYNCLNAIFTTFETIFTKFNQYLRYLKIDSQLEYMNFIPFDILDKYINIVYDKSELFIVKYQQNYNELSECVNGFKHMLNQLNRLKSNIEANGRIDLEVAEHGANQNENATSSVLNWLYIYCVLNSAKVEFDSVCEEVAKYVKSYFSCLNPKVETNPINTSSETNYRNFTLEILELQKSLSACVESLLTLANNYLNNKIDRNIHNCLKEQHDWKVAPKLLTEFKDVIFGNKEGPELVKEFEMGPLVYSISQNLAGFISKNVSYLIQYYYESVSSNTTSAQVAYSIPQNDNENVNMYVELIGEYYINLISVYCQNTETFNVLQKSMEMFIDSEFQSLANLKSQISPSSFKNNVEYLIKIVKLLNINASDSLSMLIS